ncbi:hypothetical protein [Nostoc sp.]|uniref:hypothetical protein n=1 Tax=Nostoc sp. TaxID=1180 RepID=UPI002FF7C597
MTLYHDLRKIIKKRRRKAVSQSGGRVPRHKGTGVSDVGASPVGLAAGYRKGRKGHKGIEF